MSDERQLTRREFVEEAALAGAAVVLGSGFSAEVASGRALPVHGFLELKLDINGRPHSVSADARLTLLDALPNMMLFSAATVRPARLCQQSDSRF